MLPRQPMRFLLADDPGAGKTIMAGLLIKELLIRGELERCLIVAPGSLTEQWQDELKEKFELNFELLTRDLINATGLGNPFEQRPLLIARMDMLSRDEELQSRLEQAGKQVRLPAQVARERAEVLVSRLEKRLAQLQAEAQITAKVPNLKGGALVIPAGLLLRLQGQSEPEAIDATARKRVELLALNSVFETEKALGRMPRDVSAQRGLGYDIESIDADGNLFFIEVKGRADGADSVTLTINEVNTGRNAPHRFRLALVSVEGERASPPVYVSGVDWGLPGFGDTQITKNLQQLLAAGRAPH